MGEFSIFHWLIVLAVLAVLFGIVLVPWLAYGHGKNVGDQTGYIRGLQRGPAAKRQNQGT